MGLWRDLPRGHYRKRGGVFDGRTVVEAWHVLGRSRHLYCWNEVLDGVGGLGWHSGFQCVEMHAWHGWSLRYTDTCQVGPLQVHSCGWVWRRQEVPWSVEEADEEVESETRRSAMWTSHQARILSCAEPPGGTRLFRKAAFIHLPLLLMCWGQSRRKDGTKCEQ